MMSLVSLLVVIALVGPILILGAGALMLLAAGMAPGGTRRVRETFRCPWTRRVVTADFLVKEGATHPSEVTACTAFPDPRRITCKKGCRDLADVRWGLSRGVFPRWALTADGAVTWRNAEERRPAA